MQVVFDTNAYRSLTYGKSIDQVRKEFDAITGTEERKGFQVFMAPVPWMELCSHLADPSDPAFDLCMAAMVGSFNHTRRYFTSREGKLMPQWQLLVAHTLFQHRNEQAVDTLFALDDLAKAIEASPTVATIAANLAVLESIKAFSLQMRRQFMETFRHRQQEFHSFSEPRQASLRREFKRDELLIASLTFVLAHAAEWANVDLSQMSEDATIEKLIAISTLYPAPCRLLRNIMSKMIGKPDFNIESGNRKNWYWDYQMLFYISSKNPLFLVTDDKEMITAATEVGLGSRVMKAEEYIDMLELNLKFIRGQDKSS